MKSEAKIRKVYAFTSKPVYQVYRLRDKDRGDIRENREVAGNYTTKEYAEMKAKEMNDGDRSD